MPVPASLSPEQLEAQLTSLQQQAWADLKAQGYACVAGVTTLEALLARGGIGAALVRSHARLMLMGKARVLSTGPVHHRPAVVPPEPPPAAHPRWTAPARSAGLFDPKRAAAGDDRDDA